MAGLNVLFQFRAISRFSEHAGQKKDSFVIVDLPSFPQPPDVPGADASLDEILQHLAENSSETDGGEEEWERPFLDIVRRTLNSYATCPSLYDSDSLPSEPTRNNKRETHLERMSAADLPGFGAAADVWRAVVEERERQKNGREGERCSMPPSTTCEVAQFSLIFLGYRPDRVKAIEKEVKNMANWGGNEYDPRFEPGGPYENEQVVVEIVLVWNGDADLSSSAEGRSLIQMSEMDDHPLRIFYARDAGLPNDLLNRYHPSIRPRSEALLYYDDDGPFWDRRAVLAGFELWKRNSDVQAGAMARNFRLGPRMDRERTTILQEGRIVQGTPETRGSFVPLCPYDGGRGDYVEYNYFTFAQYDANMVLPSGTFLHRNYMCYLWHPAFQKIREFVLAHDTKPDDMTVSTIVGQLSGRAPLTYPFKLGKNQSRRLMEKNEETKGVRHYIAKDWDSSQNHDNGQDHPRRSLLWNEHEAGHLFWGRLREEAINSLVSYFGNTNIGSTGWCYKTEYDVVKKKVMRSCNPEKPTLNMIPWINDGGFGRDICSLN